MIVDAHAHVVSAEMLRGPAGDEPWRPVITVEGGRQVLELGGKVVRALVGEMSRVEAIVDESASIAVDHVVLSPWVPVLPLQMEPSLAAEVCRIQNEALADAVRAHPGRVSGLGAVALQHPETGASQLDEVVAAGLAGVEVTASVGGVYLGDDRFLPFWEAAEALGVLVFVHPTTRGLGMSVFDDYYLWNTVANPVETAVAAAQLVMAGTMERHPNLRILLAHGGGAIASVAGRLIRAYQARPEARSRLAASPEESLRRFLYDTVTHDRAMLAHLVGWVGSDHVLLGSDRPFDMGSDDPVSEVRALGLAPADEARVLGINAATLLGLAHAG